MWVRRSECPSEPTQQMDRFQQPGNDVPVAAQVAESLAPALRHGHGVFDLHVADLRVNEVRLDREDHARLQRPRIVRRDVGLLVGHHADPVGHELPIWRKPMLSDRPLPFDQQLPTRETRAAPSAAPVPAPRCRRCANPERGVRARQDTPSGKCRPGSPLPLRPRQCAGSALAPIGRRTAPAACPVRRSERIEERHVSRTISRSYTSRDLRGRDSLACRRQTRPGSPRPPGHTPSAGGPTRLAS